MSFPRELVFVSGSRPHRWDAAATVHSLVALSDLTAEAYLEQGLAAPNEVVNRQGPPLGYSAAPYLTTSAEAHRRRGAPGWR